MPTQELLEQSGTLGNRENIAGEMENGFSKIPAQARTSSATPQTACVIAKR